MKSNKKKFEDTNLDSKEKLSGTNVRSSVNIQPKKIVPTAEKNSNLQKGDKYENQYKSEKAVNQINSNINVFLLLIKETTNAFSNLPEELATTFEKMIQQLEIISKTMKIMDQRIATVENQVTEIYDVHKQKKLDYYKTLPKTYAANENIYNDSTHSKRDDFINNDNYRRNNYAADTNQMYHQNNYNNLNMSITKVINF
jgi:hypothetical protein